MGLTGRARSTVGRARRGVDRRLARAGEAAASRLHGPVADTLRLEYPATAEHRPRYGWGRPVHAGLDRVVEAGAARYLEHLRSFVPLLDDLAAIPRDGTDGPEPCWANEWLPGLDTVALYGFVRTRQPARYLEIGSGQSTKVVARAIRDGSPSTRIVSVDPSPRAVVDALCDEVVRSPLEVVDVPRLVEPLRSGDVVFFDGSHRVLPNSDCVAFFLDLLPALPPGVLVGVHDVYLPHDYPPRFFDLRWSEQYTLGALLLADRAGAKVGFPAYWISQQPSLVEPLAPLWSAPALEAVPTHGTSFWVTTTSA